MKKHIELKLARDEERVFPESWEICPESWPRRSWYFILESQCNDVIGVCVCFNQREWKKDLHDALHKYEIVPLTRVYVDSPDVQRRKLIEADYKLRKKKYHVASDSSSVEKYIENELKSDWRYQDYEMRVEGYHWGKSESVRRQYLRILLFREPWRQIKKTLRRKKIEHQRIEHYRIRKIVKNLSKNDDASVRREAAEALGRIGGSRVVKPLSKALQNDDASVRREAAEALGRIGGSRVVKPLSKALQNDDASVRREAAEALGRMGGARVVKPLSKALQNDDASVRREAAKALGRMGGARVVKPLSKALQNDDASVRREAAEALGRMGGARVVKPLSKALQNDDASVRREAAKALGRMGGARAVRSLSKASQDDDESVRRVAAEALGRIGGAEYDENWLCRFERKIDSTFSDGIYFVDAITRKIQLGQGARIKFFLASLIIPFAGFYIAVWARRERREKWEDLPPPQQREPGEVTMADAYAEAYGRVAKGALTTALASHGLVFAILLIWLGNSIF